MSFPFDLLLFCYFYSLFYLKFTIILDQVVQKNVLYKSKIDNSALWFTLHLHIFRFLGFYLLKTCTEPKMLLPRMMTSSLICPFSSAISRLRSWYRVWLPSLPLLRNRGGKGEVPLKNDSCHKKAKKDQNA